jgi:NAD(P)-dependent dehydrogenase (short-subunit alcohol dehydrogenase family)
VTVSLADRRIVVVGGAAGIGLATAQLACYAGARVAIIDRHAAPEGMPGFVADVRRTGEVDEAMRAASAALGGADGLAYCAGIDLQSDLTDTTDDAWEQVIDINLTGAMRACRAAIQQFGAGGSIVLVSSGAGLSPLRSRTAYSASKAGLNMLAKAMALELAPRGIRVNALCPGAVDTGLFRSGLADGEAALAAVRARYALERVAEPEEIARAILFLLSAEASYVTGIAMAVDGGRTFH